MEELVGLASSLSTSLRRGGVIDTFRIAPDQGDTEGQGLLMITVGHVTMAAVVQKSKKVVQVLLGSRWLKADGGEFNGKQAATAFRGALAVARRTASATKDASTRMEAANAALAAFEKRRPTAKELRGKVSVGADGNLHFECPGILASISPSETKVLESLFNAFIG